MQYYNQWSELQRNCNFLTHHKMQIKMHLRVHIKYLFQIEFAFVSVSAFYENLSRIIPQYGMAGSQSRGGICEGCIQRVKRNGVYVCPRFYSLNCLVRGRTLPDCIAWCNAFDMNSVL